MVLDLVKHSTKPRVSADHAQRAVETVLSRHLHTLNIAPQDAVFNYTGDGYVCALLGDATSRLIDFINCVVPELRREFATVGQDFRVGVDFGLLHLSRNILTGGLEHFDVPGIVAARLEQVAQPNEILGTAAVRHIFAPLYPDAFSRESREVHTKDRDVQCYSIVPIDYDSIRQRLRVSLFPGHDESLSPADRGTLLIVDDDPSVLMGLEAGLDTAYASVTTATTGYRAIDIVKTKVFSVALLDIFMPDASGIDVARHIAHRHPTTSIIMMTGAGHLNVVNEAYSAGAAFFLQKPFTIEEFLLVTDRCIRRRSPAMLRSELQLLCDNVGGVILKMQHVNDLYYQLVGYDDVDAAASLLRHKARGLADEFVARLQPGCELEGLLDALLVQLNSLNRLGNFVRRSRPAELLRYLNGLAGDYSTLHPKVKISVSGTVEDTRQLPHATLYTLAVCELIDNAVDAVHEGGRVDVVLSELSTAGVLHTRVRDTGSGVAEMVRSRLFNAGATTKGIGRGSV